MSLSATSTPQADWAPPRVEIFVTAGSPLVDNAAVTCVRVHTDGTRHAVITQANLRLSSLSAIFYDYHPPRGMNLAYEITCGAETAIATPAVWAATAPNLMPVDPGTGGEARMLEWVRASGGLTTSANAATVAAGDTITARAVPVTEGIVYTFGIDVSDDATVSIQFKSGSTELGLPETVTAVGADRPFLTVEAPSSSSSLDISVANDSGGTITVSQPTLLEGSAYPTAAPPTQAAAGGPSRVDVATDEVWLLHRADPTLSVRVDAVSSITMPQRANWVGSSRIPGRRNAVHVTDGKLHGGPGEIDVRCDSDAAMALLFDLLDDAGPIIPAYPGTEGWPPWEWVQPFSVVPTNPANLVSYPYRHVVIGFEQTDQPAVAGLGIRSYAALKAEFAGQTYGDLKTIFATYRDLKTDTRIA